MDQTTWVFPKPTLAEDFGNSGRSSSDYYSGEYPDVSTSQIYTAPGYLQTVDNYGQVHFHNGAFQHCFEPCQLEIEGPQQTMEEERLQSAYQPMNASVSRYSNPPASFLGGSMMEPSVVLQPSVVSELGQQTLPTTSEPVQEKVGTEKPYATLIHEALKNADKHTMNLRELYKWFEKNTDKTKNKGTGWQNSIRHNLSINKAFKKVGRTSLPSRDGRKGGPKKGSPEWTLDQKYIDAVRPTAQFRHRHQIRSIKPYLHPAYPRCDMQGYVVSDAQGDHPTPRKKTRAVKRRLGGRHRQNPIQEEARYIEYPGDPGSVGAKASAGSWEGSQGFNTSLSEGSITTITGTPPRNY